MKLFALVLLTLICFANCRTAGDVARPTRVDVLPLAEIRSEPIRELLASADEQTRLTRGYTQKYFRIAYPNGDVPSATGACTDVVIRAFRRAGVDLQKEVHEDMATHFNEYPKKWGSTKPDTNIDHRRVPNLHTFFTRKGKTLPISSDPADFEPGDVVTWDLDGRGTTHIGLISNARDATSGRHLIVHNIGGGTNAEDRLFDWKITGHFRYF